MKYLHLSALFISSCLIVAETTGLSRIGWIIPFVPIGGIIAVDIILVIIIVLIIVFKKKKKKPEFKYQTPPPKPATSRFRKRLEESQKSREISKTKNRLSIHKD